jgi:hypothetical protein
MVKQNERVRNLPALLPVLSFFGTLFTDSNKMNGRAKKKVGQVYSLEYNGIPKTFSMPQPKRRCCTNVILGRSAVTDN